MKMHSVWFALVLSATAWAVGCSKSQPPPETGSGSDVNPSPASADHHTEPASGAGHAESAHGHGTSGETIVPGASSREIWTQIANEQSKLEAAIQSGQLSDVHHLAFGIRDLALAVAEKTSGLAAADETKLHEIMQQIKQSAAKLDAYGDSGNLSGVKEEYARFQLELEALNSLTGGV
jgi:hypothetical protein